MNPVAGFVGRAEKTSSPSGQWQSATVVNPPPSTACSRILSHLKLKQLANCRPWFSEAVQELFTATALDCQPKAACGGHQSGFHHDGVLSKPSRMSAPLAQQEWVPLHSLCGSSMRHTGPSAKRLQSISSASERCVFSLVTKVTK